MTKFNNRCSCIATTTNRKCKLSYKFIIQDKKYCFIHANMLFSKSAIIIQKCFEGFRVRKKLKNIFIPLPDDIQLKIIWYIRETHYLKQYHHKPIQKILDNRFKAIAHNPCFTRYSFASASAVILYYKELINVYYLYIKYMLIASEECSTCINIRASTNIRHLRLAIKNDNFHPADQVDIYKMGIILEKLTNKFWAKYTKTYPHLMCGWMWDGFQSLNLDPI